MKSKSLLSILSRILLLLAFTCLFEYQAHSQYNLSTSSFLGDAGSTDKVYGSRIQSDGTIVLGAKIGDATPGGVTPELLNGASSSSSGAIIRLSADGKTVLSVTRIAGDVLDLAIDDNDNIYVAAATSGLIKLNATATALTWVRLAGTYIYRVDAGFSGGVVALKPSNISTAGENAGNGTVYVYQTDGTEIANFTGYNNTQDVAIDEASQTINLIGWRQTNAFDGVSVKPVQIAYLRGYSYTGTVKWTDYDWPIDVNSPNFLNKPENNMADTRGYRCSIGADGKLYCGFEAAGGNHIFRYSPTSLSTKVTIVGGDKYQTFSNTKSEHKTFFARYEPSTGAYLKGQQLVNRNPDGTGNTIRMINGEIRADALGRVYIGGISAGGLPMTYNPLPAGSYSGGAWFMIMSSDFTTRLFVTRVNTYGSLVINSSGETSAIDGRILSGSKANYVWGGLTNLSGVTYTKDAIQSAGGGGGKDGFFAVGSEGTTPPTGASLPQPDANHIVYVKQNGAGDGSGISWANATDNLQSVIDAAGTQQVWVAAGTYQLALNTSYTMRNGVAIYGGFAGTETSLTSRNWTSNITILTGNGESVIKNIFPIGNPLLATAVLDGFTITNGKGGSYGGGIYNYASSPTLTNVIISGNKAPYGGGMYNYNYSSPTLTNVTISGNTASNSGGGMYNYYSSSSPTLTNVTLSGNTAVNSGGGMYNYYSAPKIRNSIIYGNNTGIYNNNSTPEFSYSLVQNSGGSTAWVAATGTDNSNNLDEDPLFVTAPAFTTAPFVGGDYSLKVGSPAINMGSDSYYAPTQNPNLSGITTDLAGKPRMNSSVDMGAYEYEATLPVSLVNFIAKAEDTGARLNWQTASEQNNKLFILSHSTDGLTFNDIGTVNGKGTSNRLNNYFLLDLSPETGLNYYRLQQSDMDGKITDLGIRSVSFQLSATALSVYPNPTRDMVKIKFATQSFNHATLLDLSGKVLEQQVITKNQNEAHFILNDYAAGSYIIRLTGNKDNATSKVIKF